MSVSNPTTRKIIRRHLNRHAITFENTNTEAAQLPSNGGQHMRSVVQRHTKRSARQHFIDGPFEFNQIFLGDVPSGANYL